jgi:hypothetical protein
MPDAARAGFRATPALVPKELTPPPPILTSVKAFRHFIDGSPLASPDHTCRNQVPAFLQRSPRSLLTIAACSVHLTADLEGPTLISPTAPHLLTCRVRDTRRFPPLPWRMVTTRSARLTSSMRAGQAPRPWRRFPATSAASARCARRARRSDRGSGALLQLSADRRSRDVPEPPAARRVPWQLSRQPCSVRSPRDRARGWRRSRRRLMEAIR